MHKSLTMSQVNRHLYMWGITSKADTTSRDTRICNILSSVHVQFHGLIIECWLNELWQVKPYLDSGKNE